MKHLPKVLGVIVLIVFGLMAATGNKPPAHAAKPCVTSTRPAKPEAVAMVELILSATGLPNNIEVLEGTFARTCVAVAGFDGKRRIVIYDGALFHWRDGRARWDEVGIMAHEVGHILDYHWLTPGSNIPDELVADFFAGFAVEKLGGTLSDALSWTHLASKEATRTHPDRRDRRKAVAIGFGTSWMQRTPGTPEGRTGWIGSLFSVGDRTCRLAYPEDMSTLRPRIACRVSAQRWEWVE